MIKVLVQNSSPSGVEDTLKRLKREQQKEGFFKAAKRKRHFEKPSERKMREDNESQRRRRKLESKRNAES